MVYVVTNLRVTSIGEPFQLEGTTSCGKEVYTRSRNDEFVIMLDDRVILKEVRFKDVEILSSEAYVLERMKEYGLEFYGTVEDFSL